MKHLLGVVALAAVASLARVAITLKRIPSAVAVYLYKLKTVQGKAAYTALNWEPVPTQHAPLELC